MAVPERWLGCGLLAWAIVLGPANAEPLDAGAFNIEAEYIACLDQEEYAIGGAMAGDCFIEQAHAVEAEIETLLHQAAKRFCSPDDRDRLDEAQSLWRDCRELSCSLIEEAPGNTGSYIAGSACRLDTTRKRLETLRILEGNSYAWCSDMRFLAADSHFGEPSATSGFADIAWRLDHEAQNLEIIAPTRSSLSIDLGQCSYCQAEGEQDGTCSQGLFAFQYPIAGDGFDYALLHACRQPEGIAFTLIVNLLDEPRTAISRNGWQGFDWFVNHDRIVLIDGAGSNSAGESLLWPSP